MSAKVFVPNLPVRWDALTKQSVPLVDVSPAAAFGELALMSSQPGPAHGDPANPFDEAETECIRACADQINDEDYILCVGDVALMAIVIARVLAARGQCRLLRWSRQRRNYVEVIIYA